MLNISLCMAHIFNSLLIASALTSAQQFFLLEFPKGNIISWIPDEQSVYGMLTRSLDFSTKMRMFHSIQVFSDWGHSINTYQFNCRVTVCLLLCLDGTFWPTWPLCTLYNIGLCCGTIWEAGNICSWCIFCPETSYQVWRTQHIPLVLIQNSVIFRLFSLERGKVKSCRHLSWRFFQ